MVETVGKWLFIVMFGSAAVVGTIWVLALIGEALINWVLSG